MIKAYTDHPIKELGDIPNALAPIREIDVISYDGNKYCVISVNSITIEIKSGYIYSKAGRIGIVPYIGDDKIAELPINNHFGE